MSILSTVALKRASEHYKTPTLCYDCLVQNMYHYHSNSFNDFLVFQSEKRNNERYRLLIAAMYPNMSDRISFMQRRQHINALRFGK
jgi:hypothetical protein